VGDHAFQLKTWQRIEELIGSGRTFVIVAHNLETIARLCTRCLLLDHGRLTMDGSPADVIAQYRLELRQRGRSQRAMADSPLLQSIDIAGTQLMTENLAMGDLLDCRVTLMAQRPGALKMSAMVRDNWGKMIAVGEAEHGRWTSVPVCAGRNQLRCQLPVALPACGSYELVLQFAEGEAVITTELPFTVVEREMLVKDEHGQDQAVPALPVVWEIDDAQAATVRLVTSG
jgi:hypothetical protein